MIKAIVFDYGGVIQTSNFDLFKEITDYLGVGKKEFKDVYLTLNHFYNIEGKEYTEVLSMVAKKFNVSDEQIKYICELSDKADKMWKINNELVSLINNLKKNYKIGLLSNFNSSNKLRQEIIDQGIENLFDTMVVSCEVGYQKPNPKIFDILFIKLGVKSKEVVFIDDALSSLSGSEKIGYTPILFKNTKDLKKELKKLNIEIT